MRQAGNPSSVDRLRMREMSVFKRTIPGKSHARSHSRGTLCFMRKKPTRKQAHLALPTHKTNAEKPKEPAFCQHTRK